MNTVITLATILSVAVALAAAEDATRPHAGLSCSPIVCGSNHNEALVRDTGTRGHNLNHSETLVRDAAPGQRAEVWSLWTSVGQAFADASHIFPSLIYRAGVPCSPMVCGMNHSETLVRDAAPLK